MDSTAQENACTTSRHLLGWEREHMSFDLANRFTHNPRLMSPSNFRSPPKVPPTFSGDLISFKNDVGLDILDSSYLECASNTNERLTPTLECHTPIQVQDEDEMSQSLQRIVDSDRLSLFSTDDEKDDDVVSDSSSSKLNWSLSASFSSIASSNSIASRERSQPLRCEDRDESSPEVFARRRRKSRKQSYTSPLSSPTDKAKSISDSHFADSYSQRGMLNDTRLSQCSEEVSVILAGAPITPPLHGSDAECNAVIMRMCSDVGRDSCPDYDINKASFQAVVSPDNDHQVSFPNRLRHAPVYSGCRRPKHQPKGLSVGFNQNGKPYSAPKNARSNKLFRKFTQNGNFNQGNSKHEHVNFSRKTAKRVPATVCNFNFETVRNPGSTTSKLNPYDAAWPPLSGTSNRKESLLKDSAILSVGEVIRPKSQHPQWPQTTQSSCRGSSKVSQCRIQNLSSLCSYENPTAFLQRKLQQLVQNSKRSEFGTLLEDPAILYACRRNDTNHPLHTSRGMNRVAGLALWAACGSTSMPNDPAILAVGTPLCPVYSGVPIWYSQHGNSQF